MTDVAVRHVGDPFTGQLDPRVGSDLMRDPISRPYRVTSARLSGSSSNQVRRRDRDVTYTSRGRPVQLRDSIQRHRRDSVISEYEPRYRDDQSWLTDRRPCTTTTTSRRSGNSRTSNGGDRNSARSTRRTELFRRQADYTPSWHGGQRHQQVGYVTGVAIW